jgi:hypothetical protein
VFFAPLRGSRVEEEGCFCISTCEKRRFWTKFIRDNDIKKNFDGKEVGLVESWGGGLQGIPFLHLSFLKDPDYS